MNIVADLRSLTKKFTVLIMLISVLITACGNNFQKETSIKYAGRNTADSINIKNIPAKLLKLVRSYPALLDSADENNLYWKDGTVMIYDDGISNKSHDEMLDNPDIEDMLLQDYVKGEQWDIPPAENFEPGRIRYEPFFLKMYGSSSAEVSSNVESVTWVDGSELMFSKVNGASDSLKKVIEELNQLPQEFKKYLVNPGGTFVWRNIAGTDRLSNHSFATAIDINTKYSAYWKWNKNLTYQNQIPIEIVEIFEKYGFIWGGKWYHYDTMHFEFRPELL